MRKSLKSAALVGALMLGSLTAGCYGPFQLTKNLHNWNGKVDGKWAQEGVFLVMVIVPVYGICMLGDALIFNSIQFWGGENPIKPTAALAGSELDQVAAVYGLPVELVSAPATSVR